MQDIARVGVVSSIEEDGGIRIYYQDRDQTTAPMQLFAGRGEYAPPKIGDQVVVLHLSNDTSSGVVLGSFWSQEDALPKETLYRKDLGEGAYVEYRGRHSDCSWAGDPSGKCERKHEPVGVA